MELRDAIVDCVVRGKLTPEFVDWVWRIGVRMAYNNERWLYCIDWEGAIQDTLMDYLDLHKLPINYEKPNHSIAKAIYLHYLHAWYVLQRDRSRTKAWVLHGEKTTKKQKPHTYRRSKRKNKKWKGTNFNKKTGRWIARVWENGNARSLGYFDTEEQAGKAYLAYVNR